MPFFQTSNTFGENRKYVTCLLVFLKTLNIEMNIYEIVHNWKEIKKVTPGKILLQCLQWVWDVDGETLDGRVDS